VCANLLFINAPFAHGHNIIVSVAFVRKAEGNIAEEIARIEKYYRQSGTYSKYKSLLEPKGLFDRWHKFEDDKRKEALEEWCKYKELIQWMEDRK
jgi:hypothetical protein